MANLTDAERLCAIFTEVNIFFEYGEWTLSVPPKLLATVMALLKGDDTFHYDQLIDVCGIDYLTYGLTEWETTQATKEGFSRAVATLMPAQHTFAQQSKQNILERFAVVYHLLSTHFNKRLRLKIFLPESAPEIESVCSFYPSAHWFEREAFDLYGIYFKNHPDLRRILTDYGFVGYPFRKDFPLFGHVEVHYDEASGRVMYAPVQIEPRVLVPKVIREDSRYVGEGISPESPAQTPSA